MCFINGCSVVFHLAKGFSQPDNDSEFEAALNFTALLYLPFGLLSTLVAAGMWIWYAYFSGAMARIT